MGGMKQDLWKPNKDSLPDNKEESIARLKALRRRNYLIHMKTSYANKLKKVSLRKLNLQKVTTKLFTCHINI